MNQANVSLKRCDSSVNCPDVNRNQDDFSVNRDDSIELCGRGSGVSARQKLSLLHFGDFNVMSNPIEVKYISINMTPEVGTNDWLVAVRIVPAGRDGTTVYGRTLMIGEEDSGIPVIYDPSVGEKIDFRPGDIKVSIYDIDRIAEVDSNGYAPVTYTIQTWLKLCAPVDQNLFLFLTAASKRLDTAYFAYSQITSIVKDISGHFPRQCQQIITILGLCEFLCIALNRAVNMLQQLSGNFSINLKLPDSITGNMQSLREIRNAFEHIEDRALGQVKGKTHPDAFTIFDQKKLFTEGVLTYGNHSLSLYVDILQILIDARQALLNIAISISRGDVLSGKLNNYSIHDTVSTK